MENNIEDLKYLTDELKRVLITFRSDIPEDVYKILFDLIYHSINTIKEMEESLNESSI